MDAIELISIIGKRINWIELGQTDLHLEFIEIRKLLRQLQEVIIKNRPWQEQAVPVTPKDQTNTERNHEG